MKIINIVLIISVVVGLLFVPKNVVAQYGQYGQILGSSTPEVKIVHEVKEAGIEDYLNPKTLSFVSFGFSAITLAISKRKQLRSI